MYITDNNKEINVLNALMPISLIVDTNHTNGNFLLEWRAAEFVLDSFLLNFEEGQMGIIGHTIIPPPEDVETAIPAGDPQNSFYFFSLYTCAAIHAQVFFSLSAMKYIPLKLLK